MKRENPGGTLQATALVHEAFPRLIEIENVDWQHRAHFFAVAAKIMRQILLDAARKRKTAKRGGDAPQVNLEDVPEMASDRGEQLIALDDALNRLAEADPRKARVVELRFFVGLSVEETAAVLSVSNETVMRDWRLSRAWLMADLRGSYHGL
jgi:RNA polymerase sigma-70 factor, ECF subfamily